MDGYEYENFELSLIPILVGKVLSDAGREEDYLEGIGASEVVAEDYFSYIVEGLTTVCDFWEGREVGPYMDYCWFFSDRSMMDFYRLCRDWSRQRGIPLKNNPYMERAKIELEKQLNGIYSYYYAYRYSTKVNHLLRLPLQHQSQPSVGQRDHPVSLPGVQPGICALEGPYPYL